MNNREGFISIICLIVMSVLMVMIFYLEHTTKMEHLILSATANNIQSYYCAEGKIYMILNSEKYYLNQLYPTLIEYFRTLPDPKPPKNIIINKEDLNQGDDINKVEVNMKDKGERKELQLTTRSNYNGLRTKATSNIKIVNEIFEMEIPILTLESIDPKYKEKYKALLSSISKDINVDNCNKSEKVYGMESSNFDNIILEKKNNNTFEIRSFRDTMVNPYIEGFSNKEILIITRKLGGLLPNFIIGDISKSNETIKLSGVIYVEGNLIINEDFDFNGIIIVKHGDIKIQGDAKVNIKGIIMVDNIIYNDFTEKADIIYSRHSVYKYGTYIPGFIDLRIELIKSD